MLENHRVTVEAMSVNKGSPRVQTLDLKRTRVCSEVHSPDKYIYIYIYMCVCVCRLTVRIRSDKCVVRRFRYGADVTDCTYTNLDNLAYYTPSLYID